MRKLNLAPIPKKINENNGFYGIQPQGCIMVDTKELFESIYIAKLYRLAEMQIEVERCHQAPQICIVKKDGIKEEGYHLLITECGITIEYSTYSGAFYGFMTLNQIINETGLQIPCLSIEDEPDFTIRGYMLDVSRNKVPKLETLYQLVDFLASFKINHLQLYFEGAPFPYPSFPDMWTEASVITGEEILLLDKYCRERFVELVPTQNTFGHMGQWLYDGGYLELAECPEGFMNPMNQQFCPWPQSVNPLDENSFRHVSKMSDEILSYFSSNNYNVCCDETVDLGLGKSKEYADKVGKGRVYLEFLMKLYGYCKQKGKRMLFWADIINHYPELIPELPRDVLALNWGYYDDLPTEDSCIVFKKSQIPYCVCPGTAVWNTQIGNTTQMLDNIRTTIEKGKRHGAVGVVTTDWGDNGHIQGEAPHLPGILYGAAMSWGVEDNKEIELAEVLNAQVFFDSNSKMGEFVLRIGDYQSVEYKNLENTAISFEIVKSDIMNLQLCNDATYEQLAKVTQYIEKYEPLLYQTNMVCKDAGLYMREYALGMKFIKLAEKMGRFHLYKRDNEKERLVPLAYEISTELGWIITELRDTWLVKNKPSKQERSLRPFVKNYEVLKDFIRESKGNIYEY